MQDKMLELAEASRKITDEKTKLLRAVVERRVRARAMKDSNHE